MFRKMRRKKQALTMDECRKILREGASGVLALDGDNGYPYAVPINYVFSGDTIYFHCAKSGHKIDAIARNEKVSFCVIGQEQVMPEKFTTYYKSVIVFGKIQIINDDEEKRTAIERLSVKYAPDITAPLIHEEIHKYWDPLCILRLSIEHMSGKEYKSPS